MPGVTLTFVDADGPGDGLRNPVSTVTPSSSMVDFFSGASPLLPQAQFRLIVASNRVRLEDLVTEHELGDSSEVVARRVAGYLDLVASIALPLAYLLFILVYLLQFEAASMIQRSHNRNALSTPRAGSTRRTRTTSGGRSSSTSRRSASRRRSAATGGARHRDDKPCMNEKSQH